MKPLRVCLSLWLSLAGQVVYGQTLVETFPSDNSLFTQGLVLDDQYQLILGTGQYGDSHLGILDLKTGHFDRKVSLDSQYFGEGIALTPYGIWQLTWKEGRAFLYDSQSFDLIKEATYQEEGWGLTYDPNSDILWHSDGTDTLYQRNPQNFECLNEIQVTYKGQPLDKLNELEFANGYIYANVWYNNDIVKIHPQNGQVVQVYDLTAILEETDLSPDEQDKIDVLNGIAHLKDNQFYITGKYYPVIYQIELGD